MQTEKAESRRKPNASDEGILADVYDHYQKSDWDLRELFVALVTDPRYRDRKDSEVPPTEKGEEDSPITYTNTIADQMAGCLGCHGKNRYPDWGDYNVIKDYPFSGRFTRGHNGILWNAEQKANLQKWVDSGRPE